MTRVDASRSSRLSLRVGRWSGSRCPVVVIFRYSAAQTTWHILVELIDLDVSPLIQLRLLQPDPGDITGVKPAAVEQEQQLVALALDRCPVDD